MSREAVANFLVNVEREKATRDAIQAAVVGQQDHLAAITRVAAKLGFEFSSAELADVIDAVRVQQAQPLSDEQLGAVAGGVGAQPVRQQQLNLPVALKDFNLSLIPK